MLSALPPVSSSVSLSSQASTPGGTVVAASAWAETAQRVEAEERAAADDELLARRRRERVRRTMLQ
jgi:hypothetical protein|tara:strand:+ start:187 stop:384 length:198 start_codon:yes stop_codon:yes gene_type:complete